MGIIYKLTNTLTKKSYIGYTSKTVEERFKVHCGSASGGSKTHLHRSMRKHGYHVWDLIVLETNDDNEYLLNERESYHIAQYKNMCIPLYNMTEGGEGGDTSKSPNYIEGMKNRRDMSGENNSMYGRSRKGEKHKGGENIAKGTKAAWDNDDGSRRAEASARILGNKNPAFGKVPPNAISIIFEGVEYPSISACMKETKRSGKYIKKQMEII